MDKIITVLGYKKFITEMSYAPDCLKWLKKSSCIQKLKKWMKYFLYDLVL